MPYETQLAMRKLNLPLFCYRGILYSIHNIVLPLFSSVKSGFNLKKETSFFLEDNSCFTQGIMETWTNKTMEVDKFKYY